jgi:hypothetical protein
MSDRHSFVILNLFQDLSQQSTKPAGVLKRVQDDDALPHNDDFLSRRGAVWNGI